MKLLILCLIWPALFIFNVAAAQVATSSITFTQTKTSWSSPYLYGRSQLASELDRIIAGRPNSNDQYTVLVKSMRQGEVLYSRNIYMPLVPASTLKIFTAAAALTFLGSNYRFSTQLLTDAKEIKNGVLQGNLYIVLSGDPTLTYNDLVNLMLLLNRYQITAIAGNIYLDNTAYDQKFYGPGWDGKDKFYCYAAPISASIINHNCLALQLAPGKFKGAQTTVITSPKYFYPTITNSVTTQNKKSKNCSLHLNNEENSRISLNGCMPQGRFAGFSYVVTNIPDYNRALFKNIISKMGIAVAGKITFASAPANLSLIGQHASQPLNQLVTALLKKSDNIIAGALFKKIGQLYTRMPGSWENGSFAVRQILNKYAGLNTSGLRILDGSGLSTYNFASAHQMMQVLDYSFHHQQTSYDFVSALPIAGVDGTLKNRMQNIARKVRAKTGTISGVASLAGYVISGSKEPLAFVIIFNGNKSQGWQFKAIEDQIVTALTRYVK